MIFDAAFKQVWYLLKSRHLFPIVHLSWVEWQLLVPVFMIMSLIAWLEANMFIKVHGFYSLTERISASCGKTMNVINMLYMINFSNIQKEDAHVNRDI